MAEEVEAGWWLEAGDAVMRREEQRDADWTGLIDRR
jgi:hypothetical protein